MQKLKNNEAWPKFTGSYKKKRVISLNPNLSDLKYNFVELYCNY